jgi:hypothetical protein
MTERADRFDRSDFDGRPSMKPVKAVLADDSEPYDYVVQPGDTLERIAEKWLGGASEWPHLYQANRSRIKDPNRIQPGLKLVIPPRRDGSTTHQLRVRGQSVPLVDGTKVPVGTTRLKRLYLTYKNLPKIERMRFLKIGDEAEQDFSKEEWKKADLEWLKDLAGAPLPLDTGVALYRAYRRLPIAHRMSLLRATVENEVEFTMDEMNQTDIRKIDPSELEPNYGRRTTV